MLRTVRARGKAPENVSGKVKSAPCSGSGFGVLSVPLCPAVWGTGRGSSHLCWGSGTDPERDGSYGMVGYGMVG